MKTHFYEDIWSKIQNPARMRDNLIAAGRKSFQKVEKWIILHFQKKVFWSLNHFCPLEEKNTLDKIDYCQAT